MSGRSVLKSTRVEAMVPLLILFVCILSYGTLIPWLGFYWDDWPAMWVSHSLGPRALMPYASGDRPFMGWVWYILAALLGEVPLHWHIFVLLIRWLTAVTLWWSLRGIWPERNQEVTSIALLFAVYPGFTQQSIAWSYSQFLLQLLIVILSFGTMIWAQRAARMFWLFSGISWLSSIFGIVVGEYYWGLELLRPAVLWMVLRNQNTSKVQLRRRVLMNWFPYLPPITLYLIWRLFVFKPTYVPLDQSRVLAKIFANPIRELAVRVYVAFGDVLQSAFMAWGQTVLPDMFSFDRFGSIVAELGFMCLAALVTILYLRRTDSDVERSPDAMQRWTKQAIIGGLVAILAGGLPIWLGNRFIKLGAEFDRYALPAMIGACILLVGLIQMTIKTRLQQIIVVGVFVSLAVGFHFRTATRFSHDWATQKSLYWQLSWRVPGLKPGTSVLIDQLPLIFARPYSLTAALNFIYAPHHSSHQLSYWGYILSRDFGRKIPRLANDVGLADIFPGVPNGSITFVGSTSKSLVIWFSPPSCLRVLDSNPNALLQLPPLLRAAQRISHTDLIMVGDNFRAQPPAYIFGSEPKHAWCYYFQKAEVARQLSDWKQIGQIGDEARRLGFAADDATEWLPFIEGYSRIGEHSKAKELTILAFQNSPILQPDLCNLWRRFQENVPSSATFTASLNNIETNLSCAIATPQA
jgi:hypothetical protein